METDIRIIRRLAEIMATDKEDRTILLAEGQYEGWTGPTDGADRTEGYANWVAYLSSCDRAVWISNGDPVWYDADNLQDAVDKAKEMGLPFWPEEEKPHRGCKSPAEYAPSPWRR